MKSFFKELFSKEWLDFISHHSQVLHFKTGETIFSAGEDTKGIYMIESGKVKITYRQFNGTDLLIRLSGENQIIGHRGLGGNWTYPITAYVLADTTVTFIPTDLFKTLVKVNPEFSYHMLNFFAEQLRKSEIRIMQYPVKNRVIRAILENFDAYGFESKKSTKLSYTLSRNDIASKANTTYETVIRTLAELNKKKLIKIDGKSLHILEVDKLRQLANLEDK